MLQVRTPTAPGPGVLIVPTIFGPNHEVEALLEQCAVLGAVAATYDPFWRGDGGALPFPGGMQRALARYAAFDERHGLEDVCRATAELVRHPLCNGDLLLLGICFGGKFATVAAVQESASALSVWHGGGLERYVEWVERLECPTQFHFGERDRMIPAEVRAAVQRAGSRAPSSEHIEVWTHAGADHGFSHLPPAPVHEPAAAGAALNAFLRQVREAVAGTPF